MQRGWVVSPDYRAAIAAIKTVRTDLGISQRELGRRLNKPSSFINKIEQLERRLDIIEFIAIASAMDMKPTVLLNSILAVLPDDIAI